MKQQDPEKTEESRRREEAEVLLAVQRVLQGEEQAFEEIIRHYTPILFSLAYRFLQDSHEAEDALQEIFLKAYRSLSKFRLNNRFHPWIYTIAVNYLRSFSRKQQAKSRPQLVAFDQDALAALPASGRHDPSLLAEEAEGERLAAEALNSLRPAYREVFVLRQLEGFSVEMTAKLLKLPEGTVKTYLHRARRDMAEYLTLADWN